MTKGLMKSSKTANKLYRQNICKPKVHPNYTRYAKYRIMYNKLKQIAKKNHYANQLNAFKNDSKNNMELIKKFDWEKQRHMATNAKMNVWSHASCIPMDDALFKRWSSKNSEFICHSCSFTNGNYIIGTALHDCKGTRLSKL